VTDLETAIRFEFDERISERVSGGALETAVIVSPTAGDYEVRHARQSLTVVLDGGLRPGLVYRVTLAPTVLDMFGNSLADPFELVFSTGAEPVPTTMAGEVWDRISGRIVSEAVLVAIDEDSLVHRSTSDREGIFAFRYLPAGSFDVIAFQDQNRNGEPDSTEVQGEVPVAIAAGDTVLLEIPILTPDTSAANVTGADAVDSVTVAILFDDFLDHESGVDDIDVVFSSDSTDAPAVVEVLHETAYVAWVEMVADSFARLDSIEGEAEAAAQAAQEAAGSAGDTLATSGESVEGAVLAVSAGDSAVVDPVDDDVTPADTVVLAPGVSVAPGVQGAGGPSLRARDQRDPPPSLPRLEGSAAGRTADGRRVLPGRRLVVRVDPPIPLGVEFVVTVSGVTNIVGRTGGGGETSLERAVVIDSTEVVDSIASADSGAVRDSGLVADTGRVSPQATETTGVRRIRR